MENKLFKRNWGKGVCKNNDRFVRIGPAKHSKHSVKVGKQDDSDTDLWNGGTVFDSGDDPKDEDLAAFLTANTSFLVHITQTAAFSEPLLQVVFRIHQKNAKF